MRDHADNVVIVCSIENIDPMGVHTGDSVTVAPQQTLTDRTYQKLRDQAIAVIRAVGVETGGSNVQFAVNPATDEIVVIEMNPRVSRVERARVQGDRVPDREDRRPARGRLHARRDPQRHHPRDARRASSRRSTTWSSSGRGSRSRSSRASTPALSTHMKSVGEVMAIGRTFGQAFGKALRSRELDALPSLEGSDEELLTRLETPGADRFDVLLELQRRGVSDGEIRARTGIDPWFLRELRDLDRAFDGVRTYKAVDTCAAEFEAETPYYYSAWERTRADRGPPRRPAERDDPRLRPEPDRPGDRVRLLLRARGDDRARVRPRRGDGQLQPGDGLDRLRHVRPAVLRAADARGRARDRRGRAARGRDRVLRRPDAAAARRRAWRRPACRCSARSPRRSTWPRTAAASARCSSGSGCKAPPYALAHTPEEALAAGPRIGFPVLVRPSYVLGGRAMELAYDEEMLADYLRRTQPAGRDLPRPLPRERDRGRRRRDLRRRGRLDRRDHAARRGGRHPLRRLRLRAAAALARRGDAGGDPRRPRATSRSRSASSA